MKLKILYLILFILIFIPIGLCEIIKDDINLNNTKIYDKNDKIIFIYDKNNEKSMDIKLISTISDIDKFIKIIEITNYIEYIPNKKNDFITKTKRIYGKNDIYKIKYFIEKYNYTFDYILINESFFNNKTGKNETKLINKSIIKNIKPFWIEFNPYDKIMFKNESFKLKIIHYKKPELGFFKIQTTPIFKNIECKEFTWWNGNWNLKRAILINNTNGDNVIDYQLRSINLSIYQINASSARIINETSGLIQSHWNETINSNGNLEYVWCNFSNINNTWVNNTYYIYYQSNPNVNSISNGKTTFIKYDDFEDGDSSDANDFIILGTNWVSTSYPHTGNYNLEIPIGQSTQYSQSIGSKPFNSIVCGMWVYPQDITHRLGSIYIYDSNNEIAGIIKLEDGNLYGYNGGWIDSGQGYLTDNQFRIEILVSGINEYYTRINNNSWVGIYDYIDNPINIDKIGFTSDDVICYKDDFFVRKYTINESELWVVGDIQYPEGLNMTCNLKIVTHLTDKKVQIVDMNASIVNESYTNECINLTYDSYIVYMSNPVKIDSMTGLLNILDNILVQFLLFIFLIIIATLFYVFIQIVKKKGFKGVIK